MIRAAIAQLSTKDKLLEVAQELMLARGFSATTLDDICTRAGVTKGGFFHYFKSKDELGQQVLERFCASGKTMQQQFAKSQTDPLKRVYAYIDHAMDMARDPAMSKGCLLGLFSQELCDSNPRIREACKRAFDEWAGGFAKELAQAKSTYKVSFDPREVAEHLIAIMEGSMILGKARRDMSVVVTHLRHYKAYIKALFAQ